MGERPLWAPSSWSGGQRGMERCRLGPTGSMTWQESLAFSEPQCPLHNTEHDRRILQSQPPRKAYLHLCYQKPSLERLPVWERGFLPVMHRDPRVCMEVAQAPKACFKDSKRPDVSYWDRLLNTIPT